jgi:flagellar biosynthesis protein FliR
MQWLHEIEAWRPLWEPRLVVFLLILSRVSALVMTAPVLGAREAPMRVRAFLAVAMSVVVAPLVWETKVEQPLHVVHLLALIAGELVVGATLGLGVMIIFGGIQVAGQLISQVSGMALGDVFNPGFNDDIDAISQLLFYATMAAFVIVGGHRDVVAALLDTLVAMPPGTGVAPSGSLESMTTLLGQSFVLGVRASAPALTALLLATIVLGLIARTLPQLNALALGIPLNTIVALAALAFSIGTIVMVFEDQLDTVLETIAASWRG